MCTTLSEAWDFCRAPWALECCCRDGQGTSLGFELLPEVPAVDAQHCAEMGPNPFLREGGRDVWVVGSSFCHSLLHQQQWQQQQLSFLGSPLSIADFVQFSSYSFGACRPFSFLVRSLVLSLVCPTASCTVLELALKDCSVAAAVKLKCCPCPPSPMPAAH